MVTLGVISTLGETFRHTRATGRAFPSFGGVFSPEKSWKGTHVAWKITGFIVETKGLVVAEPVPGHSANVTFFWDGEFP